MWADRPKARGYGFHVDFEGPLELWFAHVVLEPMMDRTKRDGPEVAWLDRKSAVRSCSDMRRLDLAGAPRAAEAAFTTPHELKVPRTPDLARLIAPHGLGLPAFRDHATILSISARNS